MKAAPTNLIAQVDLLLKRMYGVPRRQSREPIAELVGTILSQATTDAQSERALEALCARFPTWEQVRAAPLGVIEKLIRPAGLSKQKATCIKAALRYITRERGTLDLGFLKQMPVAEALHWLMQIRGVGRKTASIVLLFSLGLPCFPVDTHVGRVTRRLGWIDEALSVEKAHEALERLIPRRSYYRLHINLIRHGRSVCQARRPRCAACVLIQVCAYDQKEL